MSAIVTSKKKAQASPLVGVDMLVLGDPYMIVGVTQQLVEVLGGEFGYRSKKSITTGKINSNVHERSYRI